MNIIIIEDEKLAGTRLAKMLGKVQPEAKILCILDGIAATADWFASHPMPDLIMLDIHLTDGSAFDLLRQIPITAPIIFTTAFDHYAIEAFQTNSIDYLLKPIELDKLAASLKKLEGMKKMFATAADGDAAKESGTLPSIKRRFVIRIGEHLKTLATEDIAYCFAENKVTYARNMAGRNFPMDFNLDALEHMLDPQQFFRINRQYIISLQAIEEMRAYSKSRVVIKLKPEGKENPVVSSERSADFKMWLGGEL